MTKPLIDSDLYKSRSLALLEYIVLALCICVIALRATFTEGPPMQSATVTVNLSDTVYSLSISAVLIFSFVLWVVVSFCSQRFSYRLTGIEIGLCLFCVAAVAAGLAAANKRLAITNIAVFLAPPLMALLLVQILDSQAKIKLVLVVIAALGVVSACESAYQLFVTNQAMIEQYQQAPQSLLEPLGIEPDSLAQFLFEHRLYTQGVRGFFTTRNSAGSFAILACFSAIALSIEKFKSYKSQNLKTTLIHWGISLALGVSDAVIILLVDPIIGYFYAVVTFLILLRFTHQLRIPQKNIFGGYIILLSMPLIFGLVITRSKGAIMGSLFATALFIAYLYFGQQLKAHKKAILILCLLSIVAACWLVIWYGRKHNRLPGGSGMLVRWQYWQASAKMYADHPFTGVGPGNFGHFYTHYKPPEALESVADPHNFPLAILTQYGPLGLVGFLAMIFIPLWRTICPKPVSSSSPPRAQPEPAFRTLAVRFLIVVSVTLLLIRPMLTPATLAGTLDVMIYLIVTLYVVPAAVFVIGFFLLTVPFDTTHNTQYALRNTSIAAALFCAVLGVAFHNLIDFAIFEPPVFTTLWALIACLIAIDFHINRRPQPAPTPYNGASLFLKPTPAVRAIAIVVAVVIIAAYFYYAWWPVKKSTAKIQQAHQAISSGQFEQAYKLLNSAANADYLSPIALSMNGRLYLHNFELTGNRNRDLLLESEKCLRAAIERDGAAFTNFERLTDVYNFLAEISPQQEKSDWLNKAFDTASLAVARYPGCERLRFELAKIAEELAKIAKQQAKNDEQLAKTDIAVEQYEKAIAIEDSFRRQFQLIYPEREKIVSRLGEEKYQFATKQIKALKKQQKQD